MLWQPSNPIYQSLFSSINYLVRLCKRTQDAFLLLVKDEYQICCMQILSIEESLQIEYRFKFINVVSTRTLFYSIDNGVVVVNIFILKRYVI